MRHAAACSRSEKNSSAFFVLVSCSPVRSTPCRSGTLASRRRPGRPPPARTSSTARGSSSCPGRARARRRACGRGPRARTSASARRSGRGSRGRPARARRVRGPRTAPAAPWRRACEAASLPATASLTSVVPSVRFIEPEQTKPPGIASTSTPKFGEPRSSAGSSSGTTGRSLTTESSPFCWTRRARTTRPLC